LWRAIQMKFGKKNQERAEGAEPNPFAGEKPALPREQQTRRQRKREKGGAVFVFHSDPDKDTDPEPSSRARYGRVRGTMHHAHASQIRGSNAFIVSQ